MSTAAYGALTRRRKHSPSRMTKGKEAAEEDWPPGLETWVDSFTALVPGEILVAHGVAVYLWTDGTKVTNETALLASLFILVLGCVVVYFFLGLGWRNRDVWDWWDGGRVLVTIGAFFGWMMVQKPSALDALPPLSDRWKVVLVAGIAIVGYYISNKAWNKADEKPAPSSS